ncbi:MAG: replicative DNA helicase [Peptoniphilaceae bacterium]|nr:replicative DNA helicase [Peptoniphilaceae bacterium]MCI6659418.1 replicative DNA helicase [Peptoniphilaceae bacterium]MDD7434623.1 replicative DNA helicase [Peptoniphilaceae bacterium]MDY3075122.1 replicative DNA helicase [Peptoniphilaceae bacterium]MDY4196655.1 replicative DNA helicase [Peptoniphilaceae bacterium]
MAERVANPPASLSAERSVLGCIFLKNSTLNIVAEKLHVEDFYSQKHQSLFQAMLELSAAHEPIDFTTVEANLRQKGIFEEMGGPEFLFSITDEQFYIANINSYVEIVAGHSLRRALIRYGDEIMRTSTEGADDPEALLERAEEQILAINRNRTGAGLTLLAETIEQTVNHISELSMHQGELTGIPTGFRDLDSQLAGLQRSDLVLLAARPSMGKTALGVNMAYNAARFTDAEGNHPYRVAIFSLEMSKLQLSQRLLSMASGVNLQRIIAGDFQTTEDWEALFRGVSTLKNLPLYIDDTSAITVSELRAKCRRMKLEKGLDLVVIDYLQLMNADAGGRNENRQQEITQISRGLKGLAKELDCPVLALSQLSRKTESREGARPLMSDMRESGAIEQDADVVMLLYREDYYNPDSENANQTEVIIAKHRNGPTGTVKLFFKKELTKFGDLSYETDPTA